ncbi:ABC transporter permease [Bacteriovoracaceae bacterium]|nr:ABC transporter permease [Bacteriovoracaceae bacterium]
MLSYQTKVILKKEFSSYFNGPIGYLFLIIFLFGMNYLTFEPGSGSYFLMRQADLSAFFNYIPWMYLFLIPAVSMKLWADEKKSNSIELLLTMPIKVQEAVIGKFLASWSFVGIALLCSFPLVLTTLYLGSPDIGVIFFGYLSSFLLAGAMLSIGTFFSALTKNQVVAFILTVVICTLFIMAGSPPFMEYISTFLPKYFIDLLESLSVLNHFESMGRGVLVLSDLWYFTLLIVFWIVVSITLISENKA